MTGSARFPPPWTVRRGEESFWIEDAAGHRFGFCYFRARTPIGSGQEHWLTEDEARRLAANIAKLPDLLRTPAQTSPVTKPDPSAP